MSYGRVSESDDLDRYYTPAWATRALLERINLEPGTLVMEPCAGRGHIALVLREYGLEINSADIDPESPFHVDGFDATRPNTYDLIGRKCQAVITNPPYSCDAGTAREVIDSAIKATGVPVYALTRLNFLEPASGRYELLDQLDSVLILPRVEFYGPAVRDSAGAALTSVWTCWKPFASGETTVDVVSKRERERLKGQKEIFDLIEDGG